MGNNPLRSHPSAMTADQYYDSESDAIKQTRDVLGLESVPFFERPLDADITDRQVGGFKEGENPIFETVLGNKYTVARDPDQRTTRTKIEEDVIPVVKAYAKNPRLPTGEEVVGAGKAIVEGAVETASIPGDLLTGKRSPTSVQMGDTFDIAGGAAVGAGLQTLPDNAMGMFIGRKSAEIREGNSEPIFIKEWKKLHGESPRTEEWDRGDDYPHVVGEVNYDINNFPETLKELEKVGWFKGRDGKLRREISDEPAYFNASALVSPTSEEIRKSRFGGSKDNWSTLGETLKHDNFFEQYPEFKDVPIIIDESLKGTNTQGYFRPGTKFIAINPEVLADPKELKALVLHEVMHLVQDKENFSGGTSWESQDVVKFYDYEKNKPEAKSAWSKYENDLTELRKTFYPAVLKKNKELFEFMLQRTARDEDVPIEKLRAVAKEDTKIIQAGKGGRSVFHDLANKEFQDWIDAGRPKRTLAKYPTDLPSVSWANNLSSINKFLINKELNNLDAEVEFAKDSMRETNSIISTIYSDEDAKLFKKITGKSPTKKMADMTADRFEGKDSIHSYADFIGLKDKPPERPLYVNPNEKFNDQKNTLFMLYQRNMGETEARNVSSRMDFTQDEIDGGYWDTEDIPANMQWNEKEFNKGGTAMRDQMEMNFALGGRAETVDPVSGNDVPPGSLPVEVRDDIPARLSEGEYVVPADVVRYFGVRVFEEMRMEAKMGLQQMDADGRIGGEPIAPEPSDMISDEELAQLDDMLSQKGMAAGGLAQGGMIDRLVNMARTNPVVNERIKAAGIPVEMALGGSVGVGIPSNSQNVDPRKVDEVIAKIGMAAQQNPELMRMLGERGINVPRTTAMQTPQQMQQANSPAATTNPLMSGKTIAANAGGLMGYQEGGSADYISQNPIPNFNPERYRTVGGTYFEPENYGPNLGTAPVAPAGPAAPVEPAGGCGRGMMWNGQMCVVDPNYRYEDDGGEGPEPTTESDGPKKSWFEGDPDVFTNPTEYIEKQLARGEYKKEAMFAAALVPGLGLASGVANKVDDLRGIAQARAAYSIGVAMGTIDPKETKNLKSKLDSLGNQTLASGKGLENSFAKFHGYDTFEEFKGTDKFKFVAETTRRNKADNFDMTGLTVKSDGEGNEGGRASDNLGGTYRGTASDSREEKNIVDDEGNATGKTETVNVEGHDVRTPGSDTTRPVTRGSSPAKSNNNPSKNNRSPSYGGGRTEKDFENAADSGNKHDFNKGGLMAKNKEKPRNYKKGGLASRKK